MGFLEWMGFKQQKPNYGESQRVYDRMMGQMGELDKIRESRMADWRQAQQSAFGDISRNVEQKWAGTGADTAGVTGALPGQWQTRASQDWMQNVGNPMARSIEQEWMQGRMAQTQNAEMARQQLEEQARAQAMAQTGQGGRLLGSIAGGVGGFLLGGPVGAGLGSQLGGAIGGLGQQNYQPSPNYNWYLQNAMSNQGNPVYYPGGGQTYGGQTAWRG